MPWAEDLRLERLETRVRQLEEENVIHNARLLTLTQRVNSLERLMEEAQKGLEACASWAEKLNEILLANEKDTKENIKWQN